MYKIFLYIQYVVRRNAYTLLLESHVAINWEDAPEVKGKGNANYSVTVLHVHCILYASGCILYASGASYNKLIYYK